MRVLCRVGLPLVVVLLGLGGVAPHQVLAAPQARVDLELYAMPGTLTLPDATRAVIWGYALSPAGLATLQGGSMTLLGFAALLVIAAVCGSIGRAIVGYSRGGCLVSIAVGFVGALLGQWLAGLLHLPELIVVRVGGESFPVVWAIIGSALFVALISLITGRRWR